MAYPYGTQNAPTVGNALGGLPRRATAAVATVAAPSVPKHTPSFNANQDRGFGWRLPYTGTLSNIVGHYTSSGSYPSTIHAVTASGLLFTIVAQSGGNASRWPTSGFTHYSSLQSNFVSLTFGGESNYSTVTRSYGAASDFFYSCRSSASSTSVLPAFWLDGDATTIYFIENSTVSRFTKSPLSSQVTQTYGSLGTIYAAWIYAGDLYLLGPSGLARVNKDTLAVISSTGISGGFSISTTQGLKLSQTSTTVGFIEPGSNTVWVINKETLAVKTFTIPYTTGITKNAFLRTCDDRLILMTYDDDSGASIRYGRVYQLTADQATYLFSINGAAWSEDMAASSGSFYSSSIWTFAKLNQGTQQIASPTIIEWNVDFSKNLALVSIPSFPSIGIFYAGGTTTNLTTVSTVAGSVTGSSGLTGFLDFARHPYTVA